MITFRATLQSASPYSQSRPHNDPQLEKESKDAHEKRTWRSKSHVNEDGVVVIPAIQFKNALAEAAQYLSEKIPGKRNATWTKHFLAGVMVLDPLPLGFNRDKLVNEDVYCNADGKKGSGTRVWRTFPVIAKWGGAVDFVILDETITLEVFKHHLEEAGKFIGIGRWRPRNGGIYGRFKVVKVERV